MSGLRIPVATYRLQFHAEFGFAEALKMVPYLDKLGITDVYASPLLKARRGSRHGYDVTDHTSLNPELGEESDFMAFSDALRERAMGLIVDVVPNHMEIDDPANLWWQDVLENGPSSQYADFFDIDWSPPKIDLRNRVLLPILGAPFGKVLEQGEIRLVYETGRFVITYYDHKLPVDPATCTTILEQVAEHVRLTTDAHDPDVVELHSVLTSLRHLPSRTVTGVDSLTERRRESMVAKRRLAELSERSSTLRRAIEGVVVEWGGEQGDPDSYDRLETLLAQQAYRLCHWRVAADEINYRRFFDINDLAAIRVECPDVFQAVHGLLFRLVGEGRITGFRVDHPDGLYDPQQYFLDLQAACRRRLPHNDGHAPRLSDSGSETTIYVVAEKILAHGEQVPLNWAVHGTSGYEMLNLINGVFIDREAEQPLQQFYTSWKRGLLPLHHGNEIQESTTPWSNTVTDSEPEDFADLIYHCKKLILDGSMSSELHVLARRLDRLSEQHRDSRDFTLWSLRDALVEVIACFPVYRTYHRTDSVEPSDEDRKHVESAVLQAKRRNPAMDSSVFDFLQSVLLLEEPEGLSEDHQIERREFVMKLQQLTGPVMAKGLEDTAFYRSFALASLNEVGGEPQHFGVTLEEFHRINTVRAGRTPFGMTATSTHDNKRSEDVRAWLNVLSEIPELWQETLVRWQAMNIRHKQSIDDQLVPDANEEYLLYQTLVGTWPLRELSNESREHYIQRIVDYMEKALKEAKLHSSWINPHPEYTQAVATFVRTIVQSDEESSFAADLTRFRGRIDHAAACNGIAQVLLKITVPGAADFYQGSELWSFTLVDPDNRRRVDFDQRSRMLDELQCGATENQGELLQDLSRNWQDGRLKLYITYQALQLRRAHRDLFLKGDYAAVETTGVRQRHVCVFERRFEDWAVLVVVPRFVWSLIAEDSLHFGDDAWEDTAIVSQTLSARRWRNVFTAQVVSIDEGANGLPIAHLLRELPVALLFSEG